MLQPLQTPLTAEQKALAELAFSRILGVGQTAVDNKEIYSIRKEIIDGVAAIRVRYARKIQGKPATSGHEEVFVQMEVEEFRRAMRAKLENLG